MWPLKGLTSRMFLCHDWTNNVVHSLNIHDLPSPSWEEKIANSSATSISRSWMYNVVRM